MIEKNVASLFFIHLEYTLACSLGKRNCHGLNLKPSLSTWCEHVMALSHGEA